MEVFISWSGETSKAVAQALHEWLPSVIQALHPWMSDESLKKGVRWSTKLAERLEKTEMGISCLTPDNLQAPWLHFEAGALAKRVQAAHLCPYLFHVEPTDLEGPFREFQATRADCEDTRKLVKTLNDASAKEGLTDAQLKTTFDMWWPELEKRLSSISLDQAGQKPRRQVQEMVEELLELVRDLARQQSKDKLLEDMVYEAAMQEGLQGLRALDARAAQRVLGGSRAHVPRGKGFRGRTPEEEQ